MNVLLIRPPNPLQHVKILTHTKPMNLAYLASYLRKHSFKVCIVDYETRQYSDDDLFQILNDKKPSIIGVSCMTPTIRNGAKICYVVKKYSNDYELGGMIRRYITDEYWLRPKKEQESNWEKELDKIHRIK